MQSLMRNSSAYPFRWTVILFLFLILAFPGFTSGTQEGGWSLTPEQRRTINRLIAEHDPWFGRDYVLEFRHGWNHERLPVVVAISKTLMVDYSPRFAIMPNGRVLSAYEEGAFKTIIREVFTRITEADAPLIAELAIMFGGFDRYVGVIWDRGIEDRVPADKITRTSPDIFYERQGNTHRIEFYTYDYELLRMYDCRIVIRGWDITSEYRLIQESD